MRAVPFGDRSPASWSRKSSRSTDCRSAGLAAAWPSRVIPGLADQNVIEVRKWEQDDNKARVRQTEYCSEERVDNQLSLQGVDVASRDPASYDVSDARGQQEEIGCQVQIGQGHTETLEASQVRESSGDVPDQQTYCRCSDDPAREGLRHIEGRAVNRRDSVRDDTCHANPHNP